MSHGFLRFYFMCFYCAVGCCVCVFNNLTFHVLLRTFLCFTFRAGGVYR